MQRRWIGRTWQVFSRPCSTFKCPLNPSSRCPKPNGWTSRRAFQIQASSLQDDIVPLRKQLKEAARAARTASATDASTPSSAGVGAEVLEGWELTVGIEIHAQLNASRKLFSPASTIPALEPNSHLAPFDLAIPGSQPRFQRAVLLPALRAALALGCEIQPVSHFDRKHYFYHDQPSGYQITQYYHPFAKDGQVTLTEMDGLETGERLVVRVKQVQLEQDTARTQEQDGNTVLIDFNRAGHALIEIISLPDIHSPRVAAAYVRKVQSILHAVDAVTTGMELGGLRADVNVSVRRRSDSSGLHSYAGVTGLGQRTEIKNLSTFKGVEDAIKAERDRQIAVLEAGGVVEGETRGWSLTNPHETKRLRGKEGEVDYRYMPDPDVPPLRVDPSLVARLKGSLPPLPEGQFNMLVEEYSLSPADARSLLDLDDGYRLVYFQDVVEHVQHLNKQNPADEAVAQAGPVAGNWVLHELGSLLSSDEKQFSTEIVPAESMAEIIELQRHRKITTDSARRILKLIYEQDPRTVTEILEAENLLIRAVPESEYEARAKEVIAQYPVHVSDIVDKGKLGKLQFLKGEILKRAPRGQLQPTVVEETLRRLIFAEGKT